MVCKKFLVHLHLYYFKQLDYYIEKLSNISGCDWDLYVTICEENADASKRILTLKPDAKIIKVRNIGYDVWPFIQVVKSVNLNNYDYILKLHTKNYYEKTWYPKGYKYSGKHCKGYWWRNCLVDSLIGSKRIFRNNIYKLIQNPNIGMIADKGYFISLINNSCQEDLVKINKLKSELGINLNYKYFLAGTMFIITPKALEKIINTNINEDLFDAESKTNTSKSLAHILERMFGILVIERGYEIYLRDDCKKTIYFKLKQALKNNFSLCNSDDKSHKIITIMGIKIKIKRKNFVL